MLYQRISQQSCRIFAKPAIARSSIISHSRTMPSAIASASRSLSATAKTQQIEKTSSSKPLYASNDSLPGLPVPSLDSTIHKYLESLQPLLTSEQLSQSTQYAKDFLASPLSSTLQARLEGRASEKRSWLSDWWNEAAYMGYRDRIVPFVNYFYLHKKGLGAGKSQEARAAEMIRAVREFRDMVETEVLEPEKVKGQPMDTSSYIHMFGTSRVPSKPSDTFHKYPREETEHVIVMRKNRFFKVDTRNRGAKEIEAALKQIKETVGKQEGLAVGALTSENRDVWADLREHLVSLSPGNAEALKEIESAMVIVCLDDVKTPGSTREARSWNLWTGGEDASPKGKAWNRWFDKHELIVDEAGESGFNGEHSLLDGTPTLRLNEFVLAALEQGKIPLEVSSSASTPLNPVEVKFVTDETIENGIRKAVKDFAKVMGQHELVACHYDKYGKNVIKKYKCSPDAWAQMVKQLAYGKMHGGKPAVTYESAQTRKFALGRTEVIRSASKESKAFVEAMLGDASDATRASLFRAAVGRHIQYSAWAADGQGVDRHLFGLKKLIREGEEVPALFTDEAFAKSSHWILSTSQLSSNYLDGWGYGEVVPDGYGLSYSIADDYLRWIITSTNGDVNEFKQQLEWACDEIRRMMESAASTGQGAKAKL